MNFKSLDFSFKNLLGRSGSCKSNTSTSRGEPSSDQNSNKNDNTKTAGSWETPYLKIETIPDQDEGYQEDSRRSTATLGNNSHQSQTSLLQTATHSPNKTVSSNSPSPYLSIASPNIRRSSTSDIIKPETPPSNDNRRPSTSSLLRKARERKDVGGTQMGRSIPQLATPTAGRSRSGALGQRRKSMAAF